MQQVNAAGDRNLKVMILSQAYQKTGREFCFFTEYRFKTSLKRDVLALDCETRTPFAFAPEVAAAR